MRVAHEASLKAIKRVILNWFCVSIETVQGTKSGQYPTDSKWCIRIFLVDKWQYSGWFDTNSLKGTLVKGDYLYVNCE
jgi:hypothetical protein